MHYMYLSPFGAILIYPPFLATTRRKCESNSTLTLYGMSNTYIETTRIILQKKQCVLFKTKYASSGPNFLLQNNFVNFVSPQSISCYFLTSLTLVLRPAIVRISAQIFSCFNISSGSYQFLKINGNCRRNMKSDSLKGNLAGSLQFHISIKSHNATEKWP